MKEVGIIYLLLGAIFIIVALATYFGSGACRRGECFPHSFAETGYGMVLFGAVLFAL